MVRLKHIDHRFYLCFMYFSSNHPNNLTMTFISYKSFMKNRLQNQM